MIDGLKPYPAYADSGVPSLGRIPAGWDVKRAKYFFREIDERSTTGAEELLSVSHLTGVTPRSRKNVTMFLAESTVGHKLCQAGDIIVNTMWAWMGALGAAGQVGLVSPSYAVYRPRRMSDLLPSFANRLLRTPAYVAEYNRRSTGITTSRLRLYPEEFLRLPIVAPPPEEQRWIMRFVDHADRRIQRYLRAKQRHIKLLEEQKQAMIHNAVTRGLEPTLRMKSSGNRWFPEVPEDWDVLPLRRVILRAVDGPHHSPDYVDSGVPFLSARNIKADQWNLGDAKFISEADYGEFCKRVTPEVGDVLYTKGGTTGVARAVDLRFRFQVWVHVAVLKLNSKRVSARFLAAALNTPRCYEQAQMFTRGATNQDLGLGRMKEIVVPLPPLSEQEPIVAFVDTSTASLQRALHTTQREIALLREYRVRLIADVITGKLDVREAAARMPEEVPELEPLDAAETVGDEDAGDQEGEGEIAAEEAEL